MRKRLENNVCHLEGDSMHSMTTNDERFYEKYDNFRPDFIPMKKWHDRDKNSHQGGLFGIYKQPFKFKKEFEHE